MSKSQKKTAVKYAFLGAALGVFLEKTMNLSDQVRNMVTRTSGSVGG